MPRLLRAAAAQFATSTDLAANLATTVRMLSSAAAEGAELVVLPEFCNHLSIYDDAEHAWRVAVELDGDFVGEVRATARRHGVWAQCNVTLRRRAADGPDGRQVITVSNLVIDATGELVLVNDKTVLMGAEGDHLTPAHAAPGVITSPWGTLGSYSCMDGVVPEVPRVVAAQGARVLMNSLNSFALDEASLHVPIRAAENRAWVIACCKVGPLLPPEKAAAFSEMMGVPAEMLNGAGESRIVAPDGTVVATGPRSGEAVVTAELDLERAGEPRPDGTDLWAARRPELFGALALPTPPLDDHRRADRLEVATLSPATDAPVEPERITDLVRAGVRLVVLPELAAELVDLDAIAGAISAGGETEDVVAVTSVRDGDAHVGVVVDRDGVRARQVQLHPVNRHDWSTRLGDRIELVDLSWGRLAVVVGDDLVHPEVVRLAAIASTDVLAVPLCAQEPWETELAVVERAAENRVCVVAATPQDSAGRSTIADLPPDFTLWASSRERPFDGTINQPDVTRAAPDGTDAVTATIHPARAVHRQISRGTDLVDGRPWRICGGLTI